MYESVSGTDEWCGNAAGDLHCTVAAAPGIPAVSGVVVSPSAQVFQPHIVSQPVTQVSIVLGAHHKLEFNSPEASVDKVYFYAVNL